MTPFLQFAKDYQQKKVLIFGLGLQGRGVGDVQIFSQIGAQVKVTDKKSANQLAPSLKLLKKYPDLSFSLGKTTKNDILWADVIIRNASVPWNHPLLQLARSKSIPVKMDAALFFEYAQPKKAIAITGTRGKTTTTHLIYQVLRASKHKSTLAGNCTPTASLELLKKYDPETYYIFELSSWQLQAFDQEKISPPISLITNFFPDHLLDKTYPEYIHDKLAIFKYHTKTGMLFANQDNPDCRKYIKNSPGKIIWFTKNQVKHLKLKLKGKHNQENVAAAMAVFSHLGIKSKMAIQTIENFSSIPYRLENIATVNQVTFINDTTSTTPIATIKALDTYPNSIILIGGATKNLPIDQMVKSLERKAKKIILLKGQGANQIKTKIPKSKLLSGEFSSLKDAVITAFNLAQPGDTILFSPGFLSFEMFQNEFDRGEQFNQIVKELDQR